MLPLILLALLAVASVTTIVTVVVFVEEEESTPYVPPFENKDVIDGGFDSKNCTSHVNLPTTGTWTTV